MGAVVAAQAAAVKFYSEVMGWYLIMQPTDIVEDNFEYWKTGGGHFCVQDQNLEELVERINDAKKLPTTLKICMTPKTSIATARPSPKNVAYALYCPVAK